MMITYYRDKSVHVTSAAIQVDGHSYPLPELTRIWHRRGERSWRAAAGRGALLATVGVPLVVAALGLVIALRWDTTALNRLAVIAVAALIGLLAGPLLDYVLEFVDRSYARGAHEYEIWAEPRGGQARRSAPVRLLHTSDALRFGQVYRALQRAVEHGSARRGALPATPARRTQ
jgi:hypothetical protein